MEHAVFENEGVVNLTIHRVGPDLDHASFVTCSTRVLGEASPAVDFTPVSLVVQFLPGEEVQVCPVGISDDLHTPRQEGPERFAVVLEAPVDAVLEAGAVRSLVTILDDGADETTIQFSLTEVSVGEDEGVVTVPIVRSGDLSKPSGVVCYTR